MEMKSAITLATVMHKRLRPRLHSFSYHVYYLCFALSQRTKLSRRFLSLDKWNLLSFYQRDHGARDGSDLETWMRQILAAHQITEADGDIILLTMPRILGYVFNPVSFWFCLDQAGHLRAVLSEVANTFGEHHSYLSYHDDHRVIVPDDQMRATKVFHVSPFMDVQGHYLFRFLCASDRVSATVNHVDDKGILLATSVSGNHISLSDKTLVKCFLNYPLVTLKVITLIHWEAIRIILKGIPYRPKPPPPLQQVTR